MILVVSTADDAHAATVVPKLRQRGAAVVWFDLAELPARAQLSVEYGAGHRPRPVLDLRGSRIDLRAVTAVWKRRPRPPSPDPGIASEPLRGYVRQETADAWAGTTSLLDCVWLPAPGWQEQRASYKPLQLQVATALGFEIPPTLMTNSPQEFLAFHRRHNGNLISKTFHNRFVPPDPTEGAGAYALTEVVANRDVGHADVVRYCPVIVQPYVDKRVELRVTVVGDRVFPVEIQSQWTNHTRYDWRHSDDHHERYTVHDLPRRLARRCAQLVQRLGLRYGAIDLILTPAGRYVFLEINPNGAWLGMERMTGLGISDAICDLLLSGERTAVSVAVPPDATAEPSPEPVPVAASSAARRPVRIPRRLGPAVSDTLRYLLRLARAGTPPAQALAGFRRLAGRHREFDMDLVWEVEAHLGTVHYDTLLRVPRAGVLSLAFSPDRGVPWALRHAHHVRESDLLRVNGRTLNMQTVMGYLDAIWYDARLVARLVDGCLVREAVDARGIQASDAEVRAAVRAFRRAHGLEASAALEAWLSRHGWNSHDLAHEIRRQVIAGKLRAQVTASRIRTYFARHRRQLDTASIARVRLTDRRAARRLARRLERNSLGFAQALEDVVSGSEAAVTGSGFETVRRRDLEPERARAIFAASPGEVIGPLETAEGADVVRVLGIARARLDEPTRALIADILFEEWLAAGRARASVEWFWGDAERAPALGPLRR